MGGKSNDHKYTKVERDFERPRRLSRDLSDSEVSLIGSRRSGAGARASGAVSASGGLDSYYISRRNLVLSLVAVAALL